MSDNTDKRESIYDWMTRIIGQGEKAGSFHPTVKVWPEIAVRAAILRALKDYERYGSRDANKAGG